MLRNYCDISNNVKECEEQQNRSGDLIIELSFVKTFIIFESVELPNHWFSENSTMMVAQFTLIEFDLELEVSK